MISPQSQENRVTHEERAFFAQLAAMSVIFESARIGIPAQDFGSHAQSCSELLVTFLDEIRAGVA